MEALGVRGWYQVVRRLGGCAAPPQPFPVEEPFAHLSSKSCCGRFGGTWAAAAQLRHGAASEAGGRATGRVIVLTTHI